MIARIKIKEEYAEKKLLPLSGVKTLLPISKIGRKQTNKRGNQFVDVDSDGLVSLEITYKSKVIIPPTYIKNTSTG